VDDRREVGRDRRPDHHLGIAGHGSRPSPAKYSTTRSAEPGRV
jgi:hypothetical protein